MHASVVQLFDYDQCFTLAEQLTPSKWAVM